MKQQLFEGQSISLRAFGLEQDAELISGWTHDAEFMRMMEAAQPVRPLSSPQVKEQFGFKKGAIRDYLFMIQTRTDYQLLGWVKLFGVMWPHGGGGLQLGIGRAADRGQGYGREALALVLDYAFNELGLHRLAAGVAEYNQRALCFFQAAGFVEEVRRREALERAGRRWDMLHLGLLRSEWEIA